MLQGVKFKSMKYLFFLSFLLLMNCETVTDFQLSDCYISAKYIVHDEWTSPQITNCAEDISSFLEMKEYDCSFKLREKEFDIEDKYVYNQSGSATEFWDYKSEGPMIYKSENVDLDKFLDAEIGLSNNIVSIADEKKIIDNGETLIIEKIYFEEKLIVAQQTKELKKDNRRFIYEFQKRNE